MLWKSFYDSEKMMIQKHLCIMPLWFIKQLKKTTHDYMGIRNTEDCPPIVISSLWKGKDTVKEGISFNIKTPSSFDHLVTYRFYRIMNL